MQHLVKHLPAVQTVRTLYPYIRGVFPAPHAHARLTAGIQQKRSIPQVMADERGSLGHALLEHLPLAANGYQILAGFDVDPKLIGQKINGVPILNSEDFGSFIQNNKPAICILTVPTSAAVDYAKQASENGVAAIWNFANVDLSTLGLEAAVENVNLMDSLYTLTYYSRDGE